METIEYERFCDGLCMPESQKVDLIDVCLEWETTDFVIAEGGEIALYAAGAKASIYFSFQTAATFLPWCAKQKRAI